MKVGFVALLDVLGFSARVLGNGEDQPLQRYMQCLQKALVVESDNPEVDYVVFSDSIVLTTREHSAASIQVLLRLCSRVLGLMLQAEIPLRGAIAHGSYFRLATPGGVFVAGRAILDAHNFETAQDWVGIMLAPTAVKQLRDLSRRCLIGSDRSEAGLQALRERLAWAAFVQPCRSIPFHANHPFEDNEFDGFAVVPSDGASEPAALCNSLDRSLEALNWLKSLAPHPSAQAKYKRSHSWLYEIRNQWRDVAHYWESLEQESI